jgi:alpha-L-fucosidase
MIKPGSFQGHTIRELDARDVRYTRNKDNTVLYTIVLGWPSQAVLFRSLGTGAPNRPGKVTHVELLGSPETVQWQQTSSALRVQPPQQKVSPDYAVAFKINFA